MYTDVCCSDIQMQTLAINFLTIGVAFGNLEDGGCPACLISVAQWWCKYSCDPQQGTFLTLNGTRDVVDPVSGNSYTVLSTAVTLDKGTACSTFDACKNTGKVKEFPPMQTCEGFFDYQGRTEAIQNGRTIIDFAYGNGSATGVATYPTASCCNFDSQHCWSTPPTIAPGCMNATNHKNASCPCAVCAGNCAGGTCAGSGADPYPGLGAVDENPLLGFDTSTVGIVYGLVAGIAIALSLGRRYIRFSSDSLEMPATPRAFKATAGPARGGDWRGTNGKDERLLGSLQM